MTDREVRLVLGGLLHDIGKVIYRQEKDNRKHSESGYDFLREEVCLPEGSEEMLDCVRYHHAEALEGADANRDALAYIVYMADHIASGADGRRKGFEDTAFRISMPLQSVFNRLNGNREEKYYAPGMLDPDGDINYPTTEKRQFDRSFYSEVKTDLTENLRGLAWTPEHIHSLLGVLERDLSYVPSSGAEGETADISLYDHVKLTAAVSSCILEYLEEQGVQADHRREGGRILSAVQCGGRILNQYFAP